MTDTYADVIAPFLGRTSGLCLNVIGRYAHFEQSGLRAMLDLVGVAHRPLPDGPLPLGPEQAFILWYNRYPHGAPPQALLEALAATGRRVVNHSHFNHLKSQVQWAVEAAFGYPLAVDPLVFQGAGVAKGDNENGSHATRYLRFPLAATEPGMVYERAIDNTVRRASGEVWTQDYRVPVFDGCVPLVLTKVYPVASRADRYATFTSVVAPREAFSAEEIARIAAFCRVIGLHYGDLDVLRDLADGRIYVVDANATPYWNWRLLLPPEEIRLVLRMQAAEALRRWWP